MDLSHSCQIQYIFHASGILEGEERRAIRTHLSTIFFAGTKLKEIARHVLSRDMSGMERVECHGYFAQCEVQNISHSSQVQEKLNTLYENTSLQNFSASN